VVDIGLDQAQLIIAAARAEAARIGVGMSIAIVDDGGNLKAFVRMDDAELAGVELAKDKAYTSLTNSIATHELAIQAAPGGPLFGLHALVGGRYVIFGGGLPLRLGNRLVGAIGVSGGLVEQDVACATAGLDAWERLNGARPGGSA
jgi:uncharacterized protein GlcG (DUF336 family)